jgi:hypothetical protein
LGVEGEELMVKGWMEGMVLQGGWDFDILGYWAKAIDTQIYFLMVCLLF